MARKGNIAWRIVFWVSLVVFVGAVGALGFVGFSYWKANDEYVQIADKVFDAPKKETATTLGDMKVDWDYLRSLNSDVVAWLYVPGTRINYPVVQGRDNEYYLHASFSQDESFGGRGGTIFLDSTCSPTFTSTNSVLYGHHMRDGSMFAALSSDLTTQEGFDAARDVYLLTPSMNYKCRSFSIIRTTGSDELVEATFQTTNDRIAYVRDKISRSLCTPEEGFPDPDAVNQMLTLSTCDYAQSDGRAVLFAQVVEAAVSGAGGTGTVVSADVITEIQRTGSGGQENETQGAAEE